MGIITGFSRLSATVMERWRRSRWIFVLSGLAGLMANPGWAGPGFFGAESEYGLEYRVADYREASATNINGFYSSSSDNTTRIQELGLFSMPAELKSRDIFLQPSGNSVLDDASSLPGIDKQKYKTVQSVLLDKWRKTSQDVDTMEMYLDDLARYIAGQPEVYDLLVSLKKKSLKLVYSPGNFATVVKGSRFHVRSATIYFDPLSAAVLADSERCAAEPGYCVASPADAFVHELIHAKMALLEPEKFIKSGALNSLIYPYAHEREVLGEERALYRSMTQIDNKPRPHRHSHSGHLQAAACVSCL